MILVLRIGPEIMEAFKVHRDMTIMDLKNIISRKFKIPVYKIHPYLEGDIMLCEEAYIGDYLQISHMTQIFLLLPCHVYDKDELTLYDSISGLMEMRFGRKLGPMLTFEFFMKYKGKTTPIRAKHIHDFVKSLLDDHFPVS